MKPTQYVQISMFLRLSMLASSSGTVPVNPLRSVIENCFEYVMTNKRLIHSSEIVKNGAYQDKGF